MANESLLPAPPAAPELEERLLSALLDSRTAVDAAVDAALEADDFYRPIHRVIYRRIVELHHAGVPHGPIDVRRELEASDRDRGELEQAGGAVYLHRLYEHRAPAEWAEGDARHIHELGQRRRLADVGFQTARLAADIAVPLEQITARLLANLNGTGTATYRDRSVDGATFALDTPAIPPAIWGDGNEIAWAGGESLMLVGPQGVGKTTLAGQLCLGRIGLRHRLLGMPIAPSASRVLYLACDRPSQIRRSFRRMVDEADRETLAERLVVWQGPPAADIARNPTLLVDLARRASADTIIIDSLKDVAADLVKDEAGNGYNRARQTATVAGIELVELHHQRKAGREGTKPRALADVYGSVWLTAGAGSVLLLWGDPGDPVVELVHLKQPMEEVGPAKLLHDATTGTVTILQGADVLQLVQRNPGLTAVEAARLMFDIQGRSPEARETEKARRRLETLARKGLVHRKDGGRGGQKGTRNPATYHPVIPVEPP